MASYPVIYDHTTNGHSEKRVAEKVWMEIVGEVEKKLKENCSGKCCILDFSLLPKID
jgi:hypothetical protein